MQREQLRRNRGLQLAVHPIRRCPGCTNCRPGVDEWDGARGAKGPDMVLRLQRLHGNAFVARRLVDVARRSAKPTQEQAIEEKRPSIEPYVLPIPGYKDGGAKIALAKPKLCGKLLGSGKSRIPELFPFHIQTAAHWVAHQVDARSGETCDDGYSLELKDVIAGRKRIPFAQATFEDIWTDHGNQIGVIRGVIKTERGETEYSIDYFEPSQCKGATKVVTGGYCYR